MRQFVSLATLRTERLRGQLENVREALTKVDSLTVPQIDLPPLVSTRGDSSEISRLHRKKFCTRLVLKPHCGMGFRTSNIVLNVWHYTQCTLLYVLDFLRIHDKGATI